MHVNCIHFLHCAAWHWDWWLWWQVGCSFHNGFAVLGGNIVSNLSTVRFVAHEQHFQLLDIVNQELLEANGQHVLCFLIAPITNVVIKIWPLNLLCTLLSIPLVFCQLHLILTYWSYWCRMNFVVLFLMILGFVRGLRIAVMPNTEGSHLHRQCQRRGEVFVFVFSILTSL